MTKGDSKGDIKTSRAEIDEVIHVHFTKLFKQIPIPDGKIWKAYWSEVDILFDAMNNISMKEQVTSEPTYKEIEDIINCLESKKSVMGELNNKLIKVGEKALADLIYS